MNAGWLPIDAKFLENVPLTLAACAAMFVIGLFAGSRLMRMGDRIGHGESLKGRSRCTRCGHALAPRDQVPIVSWLSLKGRCRYCGAPIGKREPLVELMVGICFVTILLRHGLGLETVEFLVIASALVVASVADLYNYTVPNGCISWMAGARCAYVASLILTIGAGSALQTAIDSVAGGLIAGLCALAVLFLAEKILGRESYGAGDAKLVAVAGFCFGWQNAALVVAISCVIALVVALVWPQHHLEVEDYDPDDVDFAPEEFSDADQLLVEEASALSADQTSVLSTAAIARAQQELAQRQSAEARRLLQEAGVREAKAGPADEDLGASMNIIPLGPSIALAFWIEILMGSPLLGWTMSLF